MSPDVAEAAIAKRVCTEAIPAEAYPVSKEVVLAVTEEAVRLALGGEL